MSRSIYEPRLHPRQKQRSTWSFAAGNGRSGLKPISLSLSLPLPPSFSLFHTIPWNETNQGFRQYVAFSTRPYRGARTRAHTHVRANPLSELAY